MKQYKKKRNQFNSIVINKLAEELPYSKRFVYQAITKDRNSEVAYEIRKKYWQMDNAIKNQLKNIAK